MITLYPPSIKTLSEYYRDLFMEVSEPATAGEIRELAYEEAPREIFERNAGLSTSINELFLETI